MPIQPRQLKPHFTYAQQIEKLRAHGLIIQDDRVAELILQEVNYYRFTAYGITLRNPADKDNYLPNKTIEEVYGLYRFDFRFRHLLLPLLDHFEIKLRSALAYQIGKSYGPDGYLEPANFITKNNNKGMNIHTYIMDKLTEAKHSGRFKPFVIHHNSHYGGTLPVWAAVELFTFSMLSSMYGILVKNDQAAISKCFRTNHLKFSGLILSFLELRNRCAHGDRIYGTSLMQLPATHRDDAKYVIIPRDRVFIVLLALRRATRDHNLWEWFYHELHFLLSVHPEVALQHIGFPTNWEEALRADR